MEVRLSETAEKILRFVVTMVPIGVLDLVFTMIFVSVLKIIHTAWMLVDKMYGGIEFPKWWFSIRIPDPPQPPQVPPLDEGQRNPENVT
ncbi:hypothetical protein CEXT_51541 [Caerostris extrusa]|uniref:Uncharacterized protein n=1 Tax=Caerostris extrusa TaxID=172846 RepID=A0AAV4N5A8_CAEEX|nr:hypothetical protein CEXT_51541 [Caerostris extrusa]